MKLNVGISLFSMNTNLQTPLFGLFQISGYLPLPLEYTVNFLLNHYHFHIISTISTRVACFEAVNVTPDSLSYSQTSLLQCEVPPCNAKSVIMQVLLNRLKSHKQTFQDSSQYETLFPSPSPPAICPGAHWLRYTRAILASDSLHVWRGRQRER